MKNWLLMNPRARRTEAQTSRNALNKEIRHLKSSKQHPLSDGGQAREQGRRCGKDERAVMFLTSGKVLFTETLRKKGFGSPQRSFL